MILSTRSICCATLEMRGDGKGKSGVQCPGSDASPAIAVITLAAACLLFRLQPQQPLKYGSGRRRGAITTVDAAEPTWCRVLDGHRRPRPTPHRYSVWISNQFRYARKDARLEITTVESGLRFLSDRRVLGCPRTAPTADRLRERTYGRRTRARESFGCPLAPRLE